MSPTRRLLAIGAAWAFPIAWVAAVLASGPSDGTSLSSSWVPGGADPWGETVTVVRAYGETPLRAGDVVLAVDGRSPADWMGVGGTLPERQVGDVVAYEVRRPAPDLDRVLDVDVTLTRFPLASAVRQDASTVVLCVLLLSAGSLLMWRRPEQVSSRAFLIGAATVPAALTAAPWGPGVIDLAGARGFWPDVAGESLAVVGAVAALVVAATLVPGRARRRGRLLAAAPAVPLLGCAVWMLGVAAARPPGLERLQAQLTIIVPALLATVPVVIAVLVHAHVRSDEREDRLATRLVLLGVVGAVLARLLLVDVPARLLGDPLVPWHLLALLVVPAVLACVVVAILRHRLGEIEPAVRRTLVQALVVAVVVSAFIGLVGAVDLASDTSFEAMLTGGLVALLLLPVAVGLERAVRRLVYGDREFPRRIVSDLRRLDPGTAPEEALRETLTLLARRLHLSFAAIDVLAGPRSEDLNASIGEARGRPVTIDLAVGGAVLGRLLLEVDPSRDPLGPGDRRLLEDVGSQVGTLVQAVSMNRELQWSRERLVSAREEERRRIRRDLHDGLGPSLAALAMRLEAAQDLIADDPVKAADLVGRLSDQTRAGIAEVRRLVDGLRPPALDQFGLVAALRQLADEHNADAGDTDGMTWVLAAADDPGALPAAVEVAAYRIAVEAVNNAQRHGAARTCTVALQREDGVLRLTVTDDGQGMAPNHRMGVGLSSMRERAEELGGTCTVTSRSGAGTEVDVLFPLDRMREE